MYSGEATMTSWAEKPAGASLEMIWPMLICGRTTVRFERVRGLYALVISLRSSGSGDMAASFVSKITTCSARALV